MLSTELIPPRSPWAGKDRAKERLQPSPSHSRSSRVPAACGVRLPLTAASAEHPEQEQRWLPVPESLPRWLVWRGVERTLRTSLGSQTPSGSSPSLTMCMLLGMSPLPPEGGCPISRACGELNRTRGCKGLSAAVPGSWPGIQKDTAAQTQEGVASTPPRGRRFTEGKSKGGHPLTRRTSP